MLPSLGDLRSSYKNSHKAYILFVSLAFRVVIFFQKIGAKVFPIYT